MKALVFNESWEGRTAGQIERVVEDDKIPPMFLLSLGICSVVDVPSDADLNYLKTELVDNQYVVTQDSELKFSKEKAAKLLAIDTNTAKLISQGATFDSNSFSLSLEAQTNWHVLKTLQTAFTWPVEVSTKNGGAYSLALADLDDFVGTMLSTVKGHLDSGRALRILVNAANDLIELDTITDNR